MSGTKFKDQKTSALLHKGAMGLCMAGFVFNIMGSIAKFKFLPAHLGLISCATLFVLIVWAKIRENKGEREFANLAQPLRDKSFLEEAQDRSRELDTNPAYSHLSSNIHHRM